MQSPASFACRVEPGDLPVLRLEGELDLHTVGELRAVLGELARRGERFLVDLGGLEFVDSQGLSLLYREHSAAAARGLAFGVLTRGNPVVERALAVYGIGAQLPLQA